MSTQWNNGNRPDQTFKDYMVTLFDKDGKRTVQQAWFTKDATVPWWSGNHGALKPLEDQVVAWTELPDPCEE